MKFSLKKIRRTIGANSQSDIDIFGDKVFAYSVPSGAKIAFDNGEAVELRTGLRYGASSGLIAALVAVLAKAFPKFAGMLSEDVFGKISIINENAFDITVEILAGFGDIADDSTTVSNVVPTKESAYRLSLSTSRFHMALSTVYQVWADVDKPVSVIFENTGTKGLMLGKPSNTYADFANGLGISVRPSERVTFTVAGGFSVLSVEYDGSFSALGFLQD